jgi:NUMOD1 domain
LLAAQKARGKTIYVYNENDLSLVNNNPFISIRETAKNLFISPSTLVKKLDSGIAFRGYYYYSKPLVV